MKQDNHIGYKIKLYPTKEQEQIFKEYFGACRFVYNLGIHLQDQFYKNKDSQYKTMSFYTMNNKFNELKKLNTYSWLNKFDSTSLKIILLDANNSYSMYFKGICKHPKYHKKKFNHQMFPIRSERLSINQNTIKLPSIGIIYCDNHNHSEIIGNGNKNKKNSIYRHYCNARVIFDGCDYWLSFTLEINHEEGIEANSCKRFKNNEIWSHKKESEPIGIDLGCKKDNWIVDSKGNRISRPDTSKEERKVKKYQRKLAIKMKVNELKGKKTNSTVTEVKRSNKEYTKNEEKILRKLNKAYKRITNKKLDVIHNYACSIIAEKPSSIVMEDLSVKSMYIDKSEEMSYKQRERHNKNILNSILYRVRTIIEHKANVNGIDFILADREYPSSQLCSKCGHRQKIGILRTYKCPVCGNEIDRDMNAALNLSYLGYPDFTYNYA